MSATDNEQQDDLPNTSSGYAARRIRNAAQDVLRAFFTVAPQDVEYAVRQLGTLLELSPDELDAAHADGDASTIVARAEAASASINALLVALQLAAERAAHLQREVADIAANIEQEDDLL
jgi:hypothetical protein